MTIKHFISERPLKLHELLVIIPVLVWVFYASIVRSFFNNWSESGAFGDTFGALSCLFSLLAFAGVIYTIVTDRKYRETESEKAYYASLLESIGHQIKSAEDKNDAPLIFDLSLRRKFYSQQFEELLNNGRNLPFLKDDDIIRILKTTFPYFDEEDLRQNVTEIRNRLRPWEVFEVKQLETIVNNVSIIGEINRVYIAELKRDPNRPLDPNGVATWGGMFYKRNLTDSSIKYFVNAIQQSPEWRNKNTKGNDQAT